MADAQDVPQETFISHLVELRDRLLRAIIAVFVLTIAMVPWAKEIYALLAQLKAQTFITSIEPEMLAGIVQAQAEQSSLPHALFHVKHGKIDAV